MNSVTSRFRAKVDDRHADAGGSGVENLVLARNADRHRVDQTIAIIARVETHSSADCWHAERVAIAANSGDHAGDEMTCLRMRWRTEGQGVQTSNRTSTHREDIPQNSADTGCRTLIRFDVARVIMAFHLE